MNTWPGGSRHAMDQLGHGEWNENKGNTKSAYQTLTK